MALTRISSAGIQTSPTFSGDVRIGLGATLESTGNAYVTGVTTLGIGATGDVYLYNPANSALSGTENSVYGWKAKTFCGGLQVNSAICLSRGGTNGLSLSYNNATGGYISQSVGFLNISAVGGPPINYQAYCHCFRNPAGTKFLTMNQDNDKAVDLYYNNSQRLATTNEGILVSGGATITGNLSIGGTVTYEDVSNVDSIGIITARSSIYVADSIIHQGDTDTKIDFATNQIKFTAANRLRIDLAANHFNYLYGTQLIEADSTHTKPSGSTYVARFRDTTGDDTEVQYFNTNVTNTIISWNDTGNTTSAGNLIFKSVTGGTGIEHGRFTGTGSFNLAKDFSVAGVSTLSGQLNVHGNIRIGSNEKYRLYDNSGTNRFDTYNQTIQFVNKGDDGSISPTIAKFIPEGAVELYYGTGGAASVKRFETSATGVILSSTDAGSSAEPELVLYRNSASPADADYLGQIKFNGKSDTGTQRTYAKITGKILDASNGTEDGIIEFAHRKAGSQTITGRWRSDSLQLLNGTNLTVNGDILLDQGSKVGFSTDSNTFIGQDNLDRLDFNVGGKRLVSINEGTNQPVLIIDKDGVNTGPGNSGANYNANPHGTELVLGNTSSNNHGLTIVSPSDSYGVVLFSDGSGGGLDATRGSITFTHSDNKLSLKSKIGSVVLNHKDSEQLSTTDTGVCIGILTGNTVRYRGYCGDMDSNFLAGEGAGIGITDHCNNTAFYNVLIGRETAKRLNTGCDNIIIGRNTFQTATKGCKNVIIGTRNAISFNGTDNPQNNVFIGHCVAYQMSGNMNHNVAMGSCASFAGCTGSGVAIGQNAGYGVQGQINYNNVFLGNHAGYAISTGGNNVAAGPSAGQNLYKGCLNVYLGSSAGFNQLNGGCNVAIGCGAMYGFSSNEVSVHNNVAIGVHAGFSLSTGNHGIYIGSGAGCKVTSGPANIAMGLGAMKCTTTGSYNVALNAGTRITTGSINVAIGNASGYCIGTCGCNVYIGNQAGYIGGSSFNIAIGDKAGYRLGGDIGGSDAGNRGGGNIIFGQCSGIELRCGGQNFFVGFHAGACSRETTCTIAIGRGAGSSDTRGFDNVYIGNHAGNGCACGGTSCHNVVIGSQAMYKIFDGSCNVAIGNCAAYCNINGKWNLALGNMAGFYNTTGCHNISLGYLAGHLNNNASDAISIGQYANYCNKGGANIAIGRKSSFHDDVESNNFNVAIGDCAFMGGTNMGTRKHNVAIGILAGGVSTAGSGNVFIGCYSGYCNAASTNVYINRKAGYFNKTGHDNVMIGDCAGFCGGDQNRNVFIGKQAGYCNNGDDNIAIGLKAGCCLSSGEKNIAIGSGAGQRFKSGSNNIAFGFQVMTLADVNGSNNIAMGNYTGRRIATGQGNIFFGGGAGRYVLGGSCNVAIGINAHYCLSGGNCNIAIGQNAGSKQTSSDQNVSIGHLAGSQNCTGSGNVAVGHSAGYGIRGANNVSIGATAGPADSCIDTYDNVFIGSRTGTAYTSGCNIIAIGINAGASSCCAATGCNNIHIGQNTGCKTQSGNNNITIGCRAGRNLTTGGCNIFMGLYAGGTVSTASGIVAIGNRTAQNATNAVIAIGCCAGGQFGGGSAGGIFIGRCAGRYANSSDSSNIIMGGNAGRSLTNGLNIIIGSGAAYPATTACRNLSFGGQSNQQLTTGDGNLAFGTFSLTGNTTGCCNIAIGDRSGAANVGATGSCNVTISVGSGHSLTTGSDNVFVGRCAGYGVTSGYKNISIGLCAGYGHGNHNVAGVGFGTDNVFIGSCAGRCVATASRNVFIGREAGQRINDGCYNVAIGDQAGCCMMSGSSNTVVGSFAAYHLCSGSSNTYLGLQAALCATTGSQNTIIGNTAGKTMTTGGSNVAVGHFAGCTLGSGGGNVMMGNCAGYRSSGSHNVMLGHSSGWDRLGSKFKYNVLIGSHAGYSRGTLPDGSMDVLIGFYAGACYTGTCSIGIGHSVRIPITDGSNQLAIGQLNDYWITGTCDYNVGIGTTKPIAKLDVNVGSSVSAFNIQGSEGQLFSVTNNLSSGSIFAVNDITGLPSIDVDADGTIQLAPRGTSEFVGIGTTVPTSKLHIVANNNDAAFKVGTALTVTGAGHVTFSGVTTFRGNNNPHGRGAIHLPYNCMLVFGDSYLRGAIYNTGAQLVFQALNTYRFRAWDGGGMQDWMNVNGPGGSVKIGGCHMGVSGSTNKTHSFITQPHKITMCSGVPDSATQTKRFELDSYGFNFTGITTVTGNLNVTGIATATKFDGAVQCNIVMGCNAGIAITAGCSVCSNVLIGRCAGNSIESSSRNVIIGCGAGICLNDGGGSNTFIGDQAGHYMGRCGCATNTGNTFLGHSAGKHVVNSCHAVAIGYQAAHGVGGSKFFASHTINIGCRAGCKMEGGHSIINIGRLAGASNSGGTFNINMGYQAGFNNLTGGNNFYGGYLAGFCNKTGGSNIAIGQNTFKCGTSGTTNIFMLNATGCNSNGHSNIAMGYIAFRCNSSGSHNIALGACAMRGCDTPANGTGCCNIFLGKATGCYISAGNKNTVVGVQAGYGITTGSCNVILGVDAGSNLTSNTHNVVIGPFANVPSGCSGTLTIGCCTMNWITGFNDGSVTINHGNANASGLLRISKNGNGAAELRFDTASTNTANVYLGDDEQLRIRYGATEHTRFASSGSVGIGTASPRTKLHVEGSVHASRFFQNPTALDTTVTFPESGTAVNGGVYGPYTINSGVTLTISDGSTFTVV